MSDRNNNPTTNNPATSRQEPIEGSILQLAVGVIQNQFTGEWGVSLTFNHAPLASSIGLDTKTARGFAAGIVAACDEAEKKLVTPPKSILTPGKA